MPGIKAVAIGQQEHPGPQPGDGLLTVGVRELPPRRWRARAVAVRVGGRGLGELAEGGLVLAQDVADAGDEVGELVVVVGELLQRRGALSCEFQSAESTRCHHTGDDSKCLRLLAGPGG
jgi:hypothetical protein